MLKTKIYTICAAVLSSKTEDELYALHQITIQSLQVSIRLDTYTKDHRQRRPAKLSKIINSNITQFFVILLLQLEIYI